MGQTVTRKADEGSAFWMLGGLYEVKVSSEETGGAMTVMEMTMPAGTGPPPHTHSTTETVYVLDGTINYNIEGVVTEGGPGAVFYIPKGTLENFAAATDARVLVVYTPGGADKFFEEAGEPALARVVPPQSEPPDIERIVAIAARHGMEIHQPE